MARIGKDEHPRILRMVDTEHRKVAEVAAEYGCTPANIYAILGKLRRGDTAMTTATPGGMALADKQPATSMKEPVPSGADGEPAASSNAASAPDLFTSTPDAGTSPVEPGPHRAAAAARAVAAVVPIKPDTYATATAVPDLPPPVPTPVVPPVSNTSEVVALPLQGSGRKAGAVGAAAAKPGVALVMRTAEGEETMTPFRSLDDLLSAVKPTLRAASRSPDAVWFSIQPVDLASLETDAA